jgi:hypothetical protein
MREVFLSGTRASLDSLSTANGESRSTRLLKVEGVILCSMYMEDIVLDTAVRRETKDGPGYMQDFYVIGTNE